jgi:4-amino-4-deoxy-L-arabinose transferase-like glycosyltransferase
MAVLLIMSAAVLVRFLFLNYPMRYDESYTVVVFAMRPWLNLISDYSLPNNHIFHTILVKLAISLFGTAPWSVRLPAFISGILCVPAGYVLARQMYGRVPALLSAGVIAALPMLISYSTNARGYSQYTLLSLTLFSLAIYLSRHANLAGWGLFVIVAVAGFYTVPFMLYPFGAVCLWLVMSTTSDKTRQGYGSLGGLIKYLFAAGILTVFFTLLLYLPVVIIGTGLNSLIGNQFVAPLSWTEFLPRLGVQLKNTWINWNYDLNPAVQILLAAGVLLSIIFHRRISKIKASTQLAFIIWILGVLVVLRRDPLDRIWSFLVPFWVIWACGGMIASLGHLKLQWKRLGLVLVVGSLLITAGWSYRRVNTYFPGWQADPGKIERASKFLSQNLTAGDAVAVIFPNDAIYWYYLGRLGVNDEFMHRIELETHKRVFVVVDTLYEETPALVLKTHYLSPEEYQVDQARLVYHINNQDIYLCLHR